MVKCGFANFTVFSVRYKLTSLKFLDEIFMRFSVHNFHVFKAWKAF